MMSVLTYRCPKALCDVRTTIEIDRPGLAKLRTLKLSVACPHCIGGHSVPANEMYFGRMQGTIPFSPDHGSLVGIKPE
jgi:hypothetical protein